MDSIFPGKQKHRGMCSWHTLPKNTVCSFSGCRDNDTNYPFQLTRVCAKDNLDSIWHKGMAVQFVLVTLCFFESTEYWQLLSSQPEIKKFSWLSQAQSRQRVQDTAEKAGTTLKVRSNLWSWHAESYLIRGEKVGKNWLYTGAIICKLHRPMLSPECAGKFQWSWKGGSSGKASLKIILLVGHHVYSLSNGTVQSELTVKQKVLTGIQQGRRVPGTERTGLQWSEIKLPPA